MCQTIRPSEFPSQQRLDRLIAAKCCKPATLHRRSEDASQNELATDIAAADPDAHAAKAESEAASMLDGIEEDADRAALDESMGVDAAAKCASLAYAAIDRALSLPPLVAPGPDPTDRTAAFRNAGGGQ